jgi:hypothetical protein
MKGLDLVRDFLNGEEDVDEHLLYKQVYDNDVLDPFFETLVQRTQTAPEYAVKFAVAFGNVHALRVLLRKRKVYMSIDFVCIAIRNRDAETIRVLLGVPWLTFSRLSMLHFYMIAQGDMKSLFRRDETYSAWERDAHRNCSWAHKKSEWVYEKANPTVLAIVWCMHHLPGAWADVAEPTIDRLGPIVNLRLGHEGPVFGVFGGPEKPSMMLTRVFLVVFLVFWTGFLFTNPPSDTDPRIYTGVRWMFLVATIVLGWLSIWPPKFKVE